MTTDAPGAWAGGGVPQGRSCSPGGSTRQRKVYRRGQDGLAWSQPPEASSLFRAMKGLPPSHMFSLLSTTSLDSRSLRYFLAPEAWSKVLDLASE